MVYSGKERRNPSECPITMDQATKLLSEVEMLRATTVELKQENKEFRAYITAEMTEIKVNLRQLQMTEERNKGYMAGSIQGAKVGAKFGAMFVIGMIIAGIISIYFAVTGKIDISTLFK